MICRLLLAFALLMWPSTVAAESNAVFEINYLSFESNIEQPVTPQTIQTKGRYAQVSIASLAAIKVTRLISDSPRAGTFDARSVRARLVLPDGEKIFIDAKGGIWRKEREFTLRGKSVSDLANHFEQMLFAAAEEKNLRRKWPWAISAANAHIAKTEGWTQSSYGLELGSPWWDRTSDVVIVKVWHRDDVEPLTSDGRPETVELSGGKSTLLHFDPVTRELVRQLWFQ